MLTTGSGSVSAKAPFVRCVDRRSLPAKGKVNLSNMPFQAGDHLVLVLIRAAEVPTISGWMRRTFLVGGEDCFTVLTRRSAGTEGTLSPNLSAPVETVLFAVADSTGDWEGASADDSQPLVAVNGDAVVVGVVVDDNGTVHTSHRTVGYGIHKPLPVEAVGHFSALTFTI